MANNEMKICKIFLASPSDTQDERKAVMDIVAEKNNDLAPVLGIWLEVLSWENSTYPSIGTEPQAVINAEIGSDYDIFVGLMWKKFGTKTKSADSGTEEEYNRAVDNYKKGGSCKNIMFYFCDRPLPQDCDLEQFVKVKAFKQRISGETYYFTYNTIDDFKKIFRKHIGMCLRQLYQEASTDVESMGQTILSEQMESYLDEVGASFTHPDVDNVTMSDIYVAPNLRNISRKETFKNVDALTSAIDTDGIRYLISGDEKSGKTSLAKYLFRRYYDLSMMPVLINGSDFSNNLRVEKLYDVVQKKINEQYISLSKSFSKDKDDNYDFVLIIDDYELSAKANPKYWATLNFNLSKLFQHIIAISDTQIGLLDLQENPPFDGFERYEILPFGTKLRSELINRWYSLGRSMREDESTNDFLRKCDASKSMVKNILGKNYIPSYPIYILGILQTFEAFSAKTANYSLYGFYYESLINDSLSNAVKDKKDINLYNSYLSEYCFWIFDQHGFNSIIDTQEFDEFYHLYCKNHAVDKNLTPLSLVKKTLMAAHIIVVNGRDIKIHQAYVYYFFVAKYLADNIDNEDIKTIIGKLISRAFRNEYANILMFVTHLSKNAWILTQLVKSANEIFAGEEECRLEDDLNNINNLITELPKQIIGIINVPEERDKQLAFEESAEREEANFDNDNFNYQQIGLNDDISHIDILAKFNLAMKMIDLLGEVAKKYWGSMRAEDKYDVILAAYNLGLRSLHLYLRMMDESRDDLINFIKRQLIDRFVKESMDRWDADANREQVQKMSNGVLFRLAFLASWVFIRRVSTSVGYDKLNLTYEEILKNHDANSYKLIDLSIDLNYSDIDVDLIDSYAKQMKKNNMSYMLLRELSIYHLNLFDEGYRKRQQISQIFDLDAKKQLDIIGQTIQRRN